MCLCILLQKQCCGAGAKTVAAQQHYKNFFFYKNHISKYFTPKSKLLAKKKVPITLWSLQRKCENIFLYLSNLQDTYVTIFMKVEFIEPKWGCPELFLYIGKIKMLSKYCGSRKVIVSLCTLYNICTRIMYLCMYIVQYTSISFSTNMFSLELPKSVRLTVHLFFVNTFQLVPVNDNRTFSLSRRHLL